MPARVVVILYKSGGNVVLMPARTLVILYKSGGNVVLMLAFNIKSQFRCPAFFVVLSGL